MSEVEEPEVAEQEPIERAPRHVRCATCGIHVEVPHRHFDEVNESNCADFPGECGKPEEEEEDD